MAPSPQRQLVKAGAAGARAAWPSRDLLPPPAAGSFPRPASQPAFALPTALLPAGSHCPASRRETSECIRTPSNRILSVSGVSTPQQSIPPAPKSPWPEGPEVKGFKVNTWDVEKPHTAGEQKCP